MSQKHTINEFQQHLHNDVILTALRDELRSTAMAPQYNMWDAGYINRLLIYSLGGEDGGGGGGGVYDDNVTTLATALLDNYALWRTKSVTWSQAYLPAYVTGSPPLPSLGYIKAVIEYRDKYRSVASTDRPALPVEASWTDMLSLTALTDALSLTDMTVSDTLTWIGEMILGDDD